MAFSLFRKFIRINTCGQFSEVLILMDLCSDKSRQNAVKRGVLVDAENKGVANFSLPKTKNASWKLALQNERPIFT